MRKQIATKIISGTIIFIFAMFFAQGIYPSQTLAATTDYGGYTRPTYSSKLNWDNPNKKRDNPYQLKTMNELDLNLIMSVVGCTG